ncbi:MAG: aminodeoxychorismate lyase [Proteobacteria bacterium]|nr:MAG: aminodeoxychorismate lyase [Pseudomonadota bacterium]
MASEHRPLFCSFMNGAPSDNSLVFDRGFAYGDGLFETIHFVNRHAPLWLYHLQRLERSCKKLQIPLGKSDLALIESNIMSLLGERSGADKKANNTEASHCIIKIIVTRGAGGRGYALPNPETRPTIWVGRSEMTPIPKQITENGVEAGLCHYRLSENPFLAGIKHLNRLDQVMCARELGHLFELVVLDQHDRVIEGVKSNLLLFYKDDNVVTPALSVAGVRGVMRQYLLENSGETGVEIIEREISLDELYKCSGLAFINSVFGVVPVKKLMQRTLAVDFRCRLLQRHCVRLFG